MNKIIDYIKTLFLKEESIKPDIPFLHETIDMDLFDINQFLEWSESNEASLLSKRLSDAYINFKINKDYTDPNFEFWFRPSSKGFIIFSHESYNLSRNSFINFQYSLFLKLKKEKYYLNLADIRSRKKGHWLETIRRFYLKPSGKFKSGHKSPQIFGNIHLEYIERNENPYMFRLLANSYQDQNYQDAKDFEDLMGLITC